MSYFSPAEATLPVVEEVIPVGSELRVIIAHGAERWMLEGVVNFRHSVGDSLDTMPKYRVRVPLRMRYSPWDGVDDD